MIFLIVFSIVLVSSGIVNPDCGYYMNIPENISSSTPISFSLTNRTESYHLIIQKLDEVRQNMPYRSWNFDEYWFITVNHDDKCGFILTYSVEPFISLYFRKNLNDLCINAATYDPDLCFDIEFVFPSFKYPFYAPVDLDFSLHFLLFGGPTGGDGFGNSSFTMNFNGINVRANNSALVDHAVAPVTPPAPVPTSEPTPSVNPQPTPSIEPTPHPIPSIEPTPHPIPPIHPTPHPIPSIPTPHPALSILKRAAASEPEPSPRPSPHPSPSPRPSPHPSPSPRPSPLPSPSLQPSPSPITPSPEPSPSSIIPSPEPSPIIPEPSPSPAVPVNSAWVEVKPDWTHSLNVVAITLTYSIDSTKVIFANDTLSLRHHFSIIFPGSHTVSNSIYIGLYASAGAAILIAIIGIIVISRERRRGYVAA